MSDMADRLTKDSFYRLPEEIRIEVTDWIRRNFDRTTKYCIRDTAYNLKHLLQKDTEIYLTTFEFCDAMENCGYYAMQVDPEDFIFTARYRRNTTNK